MTDHGAAVRIERCGKTFADGTRALEPATLDIARGETLVLLGPSGCGKTTMLRIIAGLEPPDAGGRVLFDGTDVTAVPIERRNVGMVFQSYALFPNMSVADNIGYGLKIRGVGSQRARGARRRAGRADQHRGPGEPPHRPALRRPAPARGAGARGRDPARYAAARRAADRARRRAARTAARRTQPAAADARHHHDLCHPRPGRSDGARRPHRGDAQGRDRADRHAARDLFCSPTAALSPNSSAPPTSSRRRSRAAIWCCRADGSRSAARRTLQPLSP